MMILVYLTSGLFLGWALGANDAANIFGTAVGTRMLRFRTAAIIGAVFVILGAVLQGHGGAQTLGRLGTIVNLPDAFAVTLSAALTILMMTRLGIPASTSQAIVGGIIGWNLFSGFRTDPGVLWPVLASWVSSPVLGAIFAIVLYLVIKFVTMHIRMHLLKLDAVIRAGLVVAGAFGAYSLGANNIANVTGVYAGALDPGDLNIMGFRVLSGQQALFLAGGAAIGLGIVTYSRRTMDTIGKSMLKLSAEAAIVIVLAQSIVLFVFSSKGLQQFLVSIGFPAIPMVPVSSSHAVVGAVIGLGLLKGGRGIRYGVIGQVALGWVATPALALALAFGILEFIQWIG
jgi:PiT family inorganic phosphate transporter